MSSQTSPPNEQPEKAEQMKEGDKGKEEKESSEQSKKEKEEGEVKVGEQLNWEQVKEKRMVNFVGPPQSLASTATRTRARTLGVSTPVAHFFSQESDPSPPPVLDSSPKKPVKVRPPPPSPARPIPSVPLPATDPFGYYQAFEPSGRVNVNELRQHLFQEGRVSLEVALAICEKASEILSNEPNLLLLDAPVCVVGDIHGQFYDLLNLIDSAGDPYETPYLFLGDYVDRGCFGCEVGFLLLSYKINYPNSFFMLRGNHESRLLTSHFNFKHECLYKYNLDVYNALMSTFDCLPIAAVIQNEQGAFFCTHGGLSPEISQLRDIEMIDRFMDPPDHGPLCDLLWSDPIEDGTAQGLTDEEMEEWLEVDYLANPTRGCGYVFGYAAVETFLRENNLISIVRAHEVQKNGYYCHYFWKRGLLFPPTITVFSAPNYCDMYGNLAAFLCIRTDRYTFHQVTAVEHPYVLPNFLNAITFSLPYALEAFTKLCGNILEGCMLEDEEEPVKAPAPSIERSVTSFGKLSIFMQKIREKRDEIMLGTMNLGDEVANYEKALQLDGKNEKRPQVLQRRRTKTM